jgi:REP element-mobilizing transposase RayT
MRKYRRRLPHWDAPGQPAFITWRLWGSLPPERSFPHERLDSGKAFVTFDALLDAAQSGPAYLRRAEIAALVSGQLRVVSAEGLCSLHAWVVMPNHVHLLWTPHISLAALVRKVKGTTAIRANRLLGRNGEPFWQAEYFDRIVRTDDEFARVRRYIEWNPVKAGLAAQPEDFPWSSAYRGGRASARVGL